MTDTSSAGWATIHEGCGGQVRALPMDNDAEFECLACEESLCMSDMIEFHDGTDEKLPRDTDAADILQLSRQERAKLRSPASSSELQKQRKQIATWLEDKPLF